MSSGHFHFSLFLLPAILVGCSGSPEAPSISSAERLDLYIADARFQEAAWEYARTGDSSNSEATLQHLESILLSEPTAIQPWEGAGISENYLVTFADSVLGFFKVEASDEEGSVRREVAAYEIDRLLHINLSPMARMRRLALPDGRTVGGSIMYFVRNAQTADSLGLKSKDMTSRIVFFDAVIGNADRHPGNWMIRLDTDEIVAIDHNRAFYHDLGWTWWNRIRSLPEAPDWIPSYRRFRSIPDSIYRETFEGLLDSDLVREFLDARRTIVAYLDQKIES